MFGVDLIELLVLWLAPVVFVVVMLVLLVAFAHRDLEAGREWLAVVAIRILGGAGGLVAAFAAAYAFELGRGLMLAPAVAGLGVMLGVAVGETVVRPRRTSGPRSASLEPRRVSAHLPRPLSWIVAAQAAVLVGTLLLTTLTASADELGRAGRKVACPDLGPAFTTTPYPGSFYSYPLLAVLGLVAVVGLVAAHAVVRRPRGFAPSEYGDDALRTRSLTVIVAAVGLALATTQIGVAVTALIALSDAGGGACGTGWMSPFDVALLVSVLVAVVVACSCGVRVLLNDRLAATDRADAR